MAGTDWLVWSFRRSSEHLKCHQRSARSIQLRMIRVTKDSPPGTCVEASGVPKRVQSTYCLRYGPQFVTATLRASRWRGKVSLLNIYVSSTFL